MWGRKVCAGLFVGVAAALPPSCASSGLSVRISAGRGGCVRRLAFETPLDALRGEQQRLAQILLAVV